MTGPLTPDVRVELVIELRGGTRVVLAAERDRVGPPVDADLGAVENTRRDADRRARSAARLGLALADAAERALATGIVALEEV